MPNEPFVYETALDMCSVDFTGHWQPGAIFRAMQEAADGHCHVLNLTKLTVDFQSLEEECAIEAICTARTTGRTGVEMEALTGVSAALLTIYDMCKAVDRAMELGHIHLEHKSGGRSGDFYNPGRGRGENP